MFILNKNNKQIQECHNSDVIKVCTKDTKNYAVAATKEELAAMVAGEPQKQPETKKAEENINEGQKNAPEGTQEGQGGSSEGEGQQNGSKEGTEGSNDPLNGAGDELLTELNSKKVAELREIAKEKGIQGYGNMNKDTLVAMIMNH